MLLFFPPPQPCFRYMRDFHQGPRFVSVFTRLATAKRPTEVTADKRLGQKEQEAAEVTLIGAPCR